VRDSAWLPLALGVGCSLVALPAGAAISAQIPAECGSTAEFENELEQRLGDVATSDTAHVTLTPESSGYQLVVEAANQRRELHDANCQELLRAAVVITLALLEPKREQVAPPAAAPAPAPEVPAPPAPAAPKAERGSHPKFGLAAGGGLHVGTLPDPTLLLEFDTQLKWTRFGIAAGFRYLLPTTSVDEKDHGARVGAVGAYLAGSFEPWPRLQTRLGVATYLLSATGKGSVESHDGSAWEVAPTLGASFTPFDHPPFWISLGLEGQLNLIRPSFEIRSYDEVFQVPIVSGSALARAGVVF